MVELLCLELKRNHPWAETWIILAPGVFGKIVWLKTESKNEAITAALTMSVPTTPLIINNNYLYIAVNLSYEQIETHSQSWTQQSK